MRPINIRYLQSIAEQQAAKPSAVDKKIAGDMTRAVKLQPGDVTVIGIAFHSDDSPLNPANAAFGRIVAQLIGKQRSIKMIGVGQFAARSIIGCSNGEAA